MTKISGKINTHLFECICIDGSLFLPLFQTSDLQVQDVQLDCQTVVKQREAAHAHYECISEALQISDVFYFIGATPSVESGLVRVSTFNATYQTDHADYRLLQLLASHFYDGNNISEITIFN